MRYGALAAQQGTDLGPLSEAVSGALLCGALHQQAHHVSGGWRKLVGKQGEGACAIGSNAVPQMACLAQHVGV